MSCSSPMQGREAPIYYTFNELQCEVKHSKDKSASSRSEKTANVLAQEAPRPGEFWKTVLSLCFSLNKSTQAIHNG